VHRNLPLRRCGEDRDVESDGKVVGRRGCHLGQD
jgi:hypothetical protein